MLVIKQYTHFLVIKVLDQRISEVLTRFASRYVIRSLVKVDGAQRMKPTRVFATRTKDHREYRFHINQLHELKNTLTQNGVFHRVEVMPVVHGEPVHFVVHDKWELHDYQSEAADYICKDDGHHTKMLAYQTGKGKMQPLSAKIKIPGGWKTMGQTYPGMSITARDGTTCRITNVFDHGEKNIYRITFADGRFTECGLEHLWKIYIGSDSSFSVSKVVDTEHVQELISKGYLVSIDYARPEKLPEAILDHDPYQYGLKLSEAYTEPLKGFHEPYMRASVEQRGQFLKGYFHNRSFIMKGNVYTICYNEVLALAITEIVRSLGGFCRIVPINDTYGLYIKLPNIRKYLDDAKKLDDYGDTMLGRLEIRSIEYVGIKNARCIEIDHPDRLYVTDDYIVTHNTVTALIGLSRKQVRMGIIILPQYIPKWISDINNVFEMDQKRIMVVRGGSQVRAIIQMADDGVLDVDVIIFSITTFQMVISEYEEQQLYDYPICPDEILQRLKIGCTLVDETHQHLHAVFKVMLYMHVDLLLGLTATLLSHSSEVQAIQRLMYPPDIRFNNIEFDRYTDVYAMSYTAPNIGNTKLQIKEWGSTTYSHTAFEKSILRNKLYTSNYMDIIEYLVRHGYDDIHKQGDKLAIFAATVKMCTHIVSYLKMIFHTKYDIRRYCDDDPYANAIEPDIRVTTIISMGAAIDIPGLRTVIMTNSIDSAQSNIQVLGRLRKLPDRDVRFYYLFCESIPKQVKYHINKRALFNMRCKSHRDFRLPYSLT